MPSDENKRRISVSADAAGDAAPAPHYAGYTSAPPLNPNQRICRPSAGSAASTAWRRTALAIGVGVLCHAATCAVEFAGALNYRQFVTDSSGAVISDPDPLSLKRLLAQMDGRWYQQIVTTGYAYDPHAKSTVAYFPVYPLLGTVVFETTGFRVDLSLLVVSHVSLVGCFGVLLAYARHSVPDAPRTYSWYVVLGFGLFPATFFHRLAYTESTFLFLVLTAFYGMRCRWSVVAIAFVIGMATATRPVGVALVAPFLWHVWTTRQSTCTFLARVLPLLALSTWGLLAYAFYLWLAFDQPLAFAQIQERWYMTSRVTLADRTLALLSLEPVWGYFDPDSASYWKRLPPGHLTLFSGAALDRLTVLAALALTWMGWRRNWLKVDELLLVVGLFGIAYATRGYEMCFFSQGRFITVAFPIYLVYGRLLSAVPTLMSVGILTVSGFFLAAYTALFAAGQVVI